MGPLGFGFSRVDRSFPTAERASPLSLIVGAARGALGPLGFGFSRVDRSFPTAERARPRRAMRHLLVILLAAVWALPAGASVSGADRTSYRLGWVEHARHDGKIVMTFRVRQLEFQLASWSAEVEFHNRSGKTIRVRPEFALLVSKTRRYDPNDYEPLLSDEARPRIPTMFFPGQRWKGTLSGQKRPRNNTFVRINFGFFAVRGLFPDSPTGFSWITDHVLKVAEVA